MPTTTASEPTADEIREMAEWAGVSLVVRYDSTIIAWNDGRLMWAALCKLWEQPDDNLTMKIRTVSGIQLYALSVSKEDDWTKAIWAAWREVRK